MHQRALGLAMSAVASAVVIGGLVSTPASATPTTAVWTGLGSDANWSTPANWQDDVVPTAGANVLFPDLAGRRHPSINDLPGDTVFGTLQVEDDGYDVSGVTIALNGGIVVTNSGSSTVSAGVRLVGSGSVSVRDGGMIALGGSVSGSAGITKTGEGTLLLGQQNDYEGVTAVNTGTLAIVNSLALGSGGPADGTVVAPGATLEIRGSINTSDEFITISGSGVAGVGALFNRYGVSVVQHLSLDGDSTINTAVDTFLFVVNPLDEVNSSAGLVKSGQGSLWFDDPARYTGGTVVEAGKLAAGNVVSGEVHVERGATAGGVGGSYDHLASAGGSVAPGFNVNPGVVSTDRLDLDEDSTFHVQISGAQPGTGSGKHSQLVVGSAARLRSAALTINVSYAPALGDVLTILRSDNPVVGTFRNLPEGELVSGGVGKTFKISYVGGQSHHDVTLTSVADPVASDTTVPAPQAVAVSGVTDGGKVYTAAPSTGLTLTGRGTAGAVVTVREGQTVVGTTTVGSDGTWSVRTAGLAAGRHVLTATQTVGSLTSAPVVVGSVTVEAVRLGLVKSITTTLAERPLVRGTGNPGAKVTVRTTSGRRLGTTTVAPNGTWRIKSPRLKAGTYKVRAIQKIAGTTATSSVVRFHVKRR